jgi:hypothetical protein
MGSVTALAVAGLLAVTTLTSPFENASGSIKPTSMRYSLTLIERQIAKQDTPAARLCDTRGAATRT